MGLSLQHLMWYTDEGDDDTLNTIVTGDESWMHHYQPESKRASMQWKHLNSPRSTKRARHQLGRLFFGNLGFWGSTVSPFSEAW
jgi:hypothetical protein